MRSKPVFIVYLFLLHGLLALVLWKSDFILRVQTKLGVPPPVQEITEHYKGTPKNPLRSILIPQRRVFRLPADRMLHNRLSKSVSGPSGPG